MGEPNLCLLVNGDLVLEEGKKLYKIKPQWQEKMKKKYSAGERFNICEHCCTPAALITARADFTILPSL